MRIRMAELFRDESCVRWWLPDDEGFSPILRSIRTFADERNATAVTAQTENLREMRHIFARMRLGRGDDASSQTGASEPDYGSTASSFAKPSDYPTEPGSDHGHAIDKTQGGSAK